MSTETDAQDTARIAILDAIPKAIEDLQKHGGPAQAEGLTKLAEAYAWLISESQPH
jgi:hypothetical protein